MTKKNLKIYLIEEADFGGKIWKREWAATTAMVIIAADEQDARKQFLKEISDDYGMGAGDLIKDESVFDPKKFSCKEITLEARGAVLADNWIV